MKDDRSESTIVLPATVAWLMLIVPVAAAAVAAWTEVLDAIGRLQR